MVGWDEIYHPDLPKSILIQSWQGQDALVRVSLTLGEAVFGVTKPVKVQTAVVCPKCSGKGGEPGSEPVKCSTCDGAGEVTAIQRSFLGDIRTTQACPTCRGYGTIIPQPCSECSGEGRVRTTRTLQVKIPAGVSTGIRIHLEGQGEVGPGGGQPGDLYVEVAVADHPVFTRTVRMPDGERRYHIAPRNLEVGASVVSGAEAPIRVGNTLPIRNIPVGTTIHCIEMIPGKGAQLARSAGTSAQLLAREGVYAQLRLRSGEVRRVHVECRATIGEVGNEEHSLRSIGKAGANRWRGIRPTVRGVVMNPVDHPHGGGEGRTSGGRHPVSPWGFPTKGAKTRGNKRTDKMIVRRRK